MRLFPSRRTSACATDATASGTSGPGRNCSRPNTSRLKKTHGRVPQNSRQRRCSQFPNAGDTNQLVVSRCGCSEVGLPIPTSGTQSPGSNGLHQKTATVCTRNAPASLGQRLGQSSGLSRSTAHRTVSPGLPRAITLLKREGPFDLIWNENYRFCLQ